MRNTMTALRLVTDDTVVQFPAKEQSLFEDGWSARQGAMKTRGLGKGPTKKLWDREAQRVGGQKILLEALKRNLREKPEKDGYTHCGLSVWLNQQRADHWLDAQQASGGVDAPVRRQAPEDIRNPLIEALGESWVRSYVDPAEITDDGWIIPRTRMARDKLMEQKNALKAVGLVGIRKRE